MSNSNTPDPTNDDNPSKLATAGKIIGAAGQNALSVAQTAAHGAAGLAGSALDKASDVGSAGMNLLRDHPNLLKWLKPLGAAGLMGALEKVDIDSALETVRELQAQFPGESPAEIAQRLTIKKAIYAGGVGLATNAVPGVSLLLAPLDWTMSASLQAELAYQIAAAYGMDLRDKQRQAEIAGIFALAFGGAKAASILGRRIVQTEAASKLAGKFAAKKLPFVGAAIGAGTNAMMLFALGNAASRYYEKQIGDDEENDNFLNFAAQQDDVFQRVLTHVARAGHSNDWQNLEEELRDFGLSDAALKIMQDEWHAPSPLMTLLSQLDCSFAASLLVQCRRIAALDGNISPPEQQIITMIEKHCAKIGAGS